ncbi:hypothetical protein CSB09_00295 [Candidatus Gracilibacteria bacterium]|nr:MAG: hypothetical protein CSB09_00295 [Candidatus Gracilibacteria bacterium]
MKFRFFFLFLIFIGVFLFQSLSFYPVYDEHITQTSLVLGSGQINEQKIYTIQRSHPQNIWYLSLPKTLSHPEDTCFRWRAGGESTRTCIDFDGEDTTGKYFTFPAFLPASKTVSFQIESHHSLDASDIVIHSMNTNPVSKKLVFEPFSSFARPTIIPRSLWGADESLRYADNKNQEKNWKGYLEYLQSDKTQKQLDAININAARRELVKKSGGKTTQTQSIRYTENGHRLVWPIEKTRQKDQIVIHHTDQKTRGISDEAMIRGVYRYHAISRGWGDIGYNYIVGQNGRIYEGRAGGDYVVGAHALFNNKNSIGIAVLGDYETLDLNKNQKESLQEMIQYVARKYGITLSNRISRWKKCTTKSCKILQRVYSYGLVGHTDVGNTSCPGRNIEVYIPFWRQYLDVAHTPVLNTLPTKIEKKPSYLALNTKLRKDAITKKIHHIGRSIFYGGKKIKIKLSYPKKDFIQLSAYETNRMFVFLDGRRKPVFEGTRIQVSPIGNDRLRVEIGNREYKVKSFKIQGNQIQIDSWNRIPEWDTNKIHNDNIFRDTIHIYNIGGKLIVVNELPIEWYLKGLGEVGNSDPIEKIKTIVVAARGYAYYYANPKNRKYATSLYDGSDDPDSFQQYLGYGYEMRAPRVATLVDATKKEIIYFGNTPIKPWYFHGSNGRTLSYFEFCKKHSNKNCQPISYLQSVDDPAGRGKAQKGHGVGISGIGAHYWAEQGWDYKKIINYYLKGTTVDVYR